MSETAEQPRYTLSFTDEGCDDLKAVGGKGANLGRLTAAGFTVPQGFTVTTKAYEAALTQGVIGDRITQLSADLNYGDPVGLEKTTAEIRDLIVREELPEPVLAELRDAYAGLGSDPYVAVRSSGTAEDLVDASFAGLHDTFLDIRGVDAVAHAVRSCWGSMWTSRATAYRHEKGFDHAQARLAVVVQLMVESAVAGVMFTGNPLTAATDEIVINAAFGLGESVVGGTVTPDEIIVHANSLKILERTIGNHATEIIRAPDSAQGTITREIPADRAKSMSLTDEQAKGLATLGGRVQAYYDGFPQDIEWAIADDRLYLLQSRPITGVPFSWDADLELTNINPTVEPDWVWTRVFADTVCTGGITPLTYSARFTDGMNRCWNHAINCAGLTELAGLRIWKYHKGELYYNCHWEKIWIEKMVFPAARNAMSMSMVPQAWHDEIAAAPFSRGDYVKGLLRTRAVDPSVFAFKKMLEDWRTKRRNDIDGLTADQLGRLTDRGLKDYIARQLEFEIDYGEPVVMALIAHMAGLMSLFVHLLVKWYDGGDPLAAFTMLISGSRERTDTQIENHALWEMSQMIRSSTDLLALFRENQGAEFFRACENTDAGREFLNVYRPFVQKYGHRGQADRDMIYPRRAEDPGRDYPAFQALLSVASPVDPIEQEREVNAKREAMLEEVLANVRRKPFGGLRAEALKIMYHVIHDYIVMRDNERQYPNDAVIMSYKRGFLEVGKRLRDRGLIDAVDDIYYLGYTEAYELLDGHTRNLPLLRAKLTARRSDVEKRMSGQAAMPKYLQRNRAVDLDHPLNPGDAGEGVFVGMPTSPGMVTGRARVIHNLSEIGLVEEGDILVTNSTDPGWTPVFLVIGGVVVETGGMLSHASCLAREYGFPAVQLEGATRLLKDGDLVRLDGNTGTVTSEDQLRAESLSPAT